MRNVVYVWSKFFFMNLESATKNCSCTSLFYQNIKTILFVIFLFQFENGLYAQQIERSVIASSGSRFQNASLFMDYTIGEVFTSTLTNSSIKATLGFHQFVRTKQISGPVSVEIEENPFELVSLYPNPSNSTITIVLSSFLHSNYSIYDLNGRLILTKDIDDKTFSFDVSHLSVGTYTVEITSSSTTIHIPFIKN